MPMINPSLRPINTDPIAAHPATAPVAATEPWIVPDMRYCPTLGTVLVAAAAHIIHEAAASIAPEGVDYNANFVTMPVELFNKLVQQRGFITYQEAAELWPVQPFDRADGWTQSAVNQDVIIYAPAHDITGAEKLAK